MLAVFPSVQVPEPLLVTAVAPEPLSGMTIAILPTPDPVKVIVLAVFDPLRDGVPLLVKDSVPEPDASMVAPLVPMVMSLFEVWPLPVYTRVAAPLNMRLLARFVEAPMALLDPPSAIELMLNVPAAICVLFV